MSICATLNTKQQAHVKLSPPIQVLISLHPWIEACISVQKAMLEDTLESHTFGSMEQTGWSRESVGTAKRL